MTRTPVSRFDIREADAFVRVVFDEVDVSRYAEAAQTYLDIIAQIDNPLALEDQQIVTRHLRELELILSEAERTFLGVDSALSEADPALLRGGSGRWLTTWWRRQDDLPGTEDNERLEEHLTRIAFAHRQYSHSGTETGFDARGEIYIRLGEPSYAATLELKDPELIMNPYMSRLGETEIWLYEQVDSDAYYLFLQRTPRSPYEVAYPTDLIPTELRSSPRKAELLLQFMEEIYAQLALVNPAFGTQYDEVVVWRALPPASQGSPDQFARRWFADALSEDQHHEWRLRTAVPPFSSDTRGPAAPLDVSMRWARFLDPDGTTRTEIYWGLDAGALKPSRRLVRRLQREGNVPSREYLLSVAVAQRTTDFISRDISRRHYLVPTESDTPVPANAIIARGDTGTYHLAMQWDQRWTRRDPPGSGNRVPGATLKVVTRMLDSLRALDNAGGKLEMSDLKPARYSSEMPIEEAEPYPQAWLNAETSLALYFEVYNLAYGPDDRTHYSVEYEVARNAERGGLLSFLGSPAEETTGARSSYVGDSRVAREYVVLDLGRWEGSGELDITVRATDETTGVQLVRTISFEWTE